MAHKHKKKKYKPGRPVLVPSRDLKRAIRYVLGAISPWTMTKIQLALKKVVKSSMSESKLKMAILKAAEGLNKRGNSGTLGPWQGPIKETKPDGPKTPTGLEPLNPPNPPRGKGYKSGKYAEGDLNTELGDSGDHSGFDVTHQ